MGSGLFCRVFSPIGNLKAPFLLDWRPLSDGDDITFRPGVLYYKGSAPVYPNTPNSPPDGVMGITVPTTTQPGIPSNCGKSSGLTHFIRRLTNISTLGSIRPGLSRLPSVTKTAPGKLSRLLENTRAPHSGQ